MTKHDEFVVMTTTKDDLDGAGYQFSREFRTANVIVLTNFNKRAASDLEDTKIGDLLDEDEELNVIYCKDGCRRYSGELDERERLSEFML